MHHDEVKQVTLDFFPKCHLRFVPIARAVILHDFRPYSAPVSSLVRFLLLIPLSVVYRGLLVYQSIIIYASFSSLQLFTVIFLFIRFFIITLLFSFSMVPHELICGLSVPCCCPQVVFSSFLWRPNSPRSTPPSR